MNKIFCLIFYFAINLLFVLKYVSRVGNPLWACLAYVAVAAATLFFFRKVYKNDGKFTKISFWVLAVVMLAGIFTLHHFIDPMSVKVDRWSAIHNFLHDMLAGNYPYLARTHLGNYPSPLPVWQMFHLPFYGMGDVGLAAIFALLLLVSTVYFYTLSCRKTLLFLLILCLSPAFWYEITVRSDLMYNLFVLLVAMLFLLKKRITIMEYPCALGILCGLLISTRVAVIAPLTVLLFVDFWKSSLKNQIIFALTTIFVFALTFAPFVFLDFNSLMFFQYNPFVLQTRQGAWWEMVLILLLSIFFSIRKENDKEKIFCYSAYSLLILVLISFLHRMIADDFQYSLFSVKYDITYFGMALPFIALSLINPKRQ